MDTFGCKRTSQSDAVKYLIALRKNPKKNKQPRVNLGFPWKVKIHRGVSSRSNVFSLTLNHLSHRVVLFCLGRKENVADAGTIPGFHLRSRHHNCFWPQVCLLASILNVTFSFSYQEMSKKLIKCTTSLTLGQILKTPRKAQIVKCHYVVLASYTYLYCILFGGIARRDLCCFLKRVF